MSHGILDNLCSADLLSFTQFLVSIFTNSQYFFSIYSALGKGFSQLIAWIFIFFQHFFNRFCPVEKASSNDRVNMFIFSKYFLFIFSIFSIYFAQWENVGLGVTPYCLFRDWLTLMSKEKHRLVTRAVIESCSGKNVS